MKILCTGDEKSLLAQAIKKQFVEKSVSFASRSTQQDLTDGYTQLMFATESLKYDVFINCARLGNFNQTLLLKKVWETWDLHNKKGHIINIGSDIDYQYKNRSQIENIKYNNYDLEKHSLFDLHKRLCLHNFNIKMTLINCGKLGKWHITPEYIASIIKQVVTDNNESINFNELTISERKGIGKEINLLEKYPKTKRNLNKRINIKTDKHKEIAKQFGKEFFDGNRKHGYGGYYYHPKYWIGVVQDLIECYNLKTDYNSSVLDVGCGKGFLVHDLRQVGINASGFDVSEYAINNAYNMSKLRIYQGRAPDQLKKIVTNKFDLVISINTVHNLPLKECKEAIREINRVGKRSFITVDSWRTPEEEERMRAWNLTAETMMSIDDWKQLFKEINYTGDYYWFIP